MSRKKESLVESVARGVGEGVVEEARRWVRWAGTGALVGAVLLGGAGFFFLGLQGLGVGAIAGAVLGGFGAWWFYVHVSSLLP